MQLQVVKALVATLPGVRHLAAHWARLRVAVDEVLSSRSGMIALS